MRITSLPLALLLLAAAPCGVNVVSSSAGTYGAAGMGGPAIEETVTQDGDVLTVAQGLGDRMFTTITSRYDAKTLTLLSASRHASCCGSYWESSVTRNADGSYDIESVMSMPSPDNKDVLKESRPHFEPFGNAPLLVGGYFFVPWIYHVRKTTQLAYITFDPLRVQYIGIEPAGNTPPEGVPARDKALRVDSMPGRQTILWYEPCTFALDAYQLNGGRLIIRDAAGGTTGS